MVHFTSVSQSCPTLCDPMHYSVPGLSVHHQLPESTQIHVHRVSDAIQPSHSLSSPSLSAFNLSKHQGIFFFFFFNFKILYWFCHISTWICHRYTCVPHLNPPPSSLPVPSLWVVPMHQPQASSNLLLLCIRVFSNESVLHIRWPKYWSFSFNIIPSNEQSGLISVRMDWLDLLAVQGTLKSLLQHHSSKVSILHHSAFFTVQLSHPYMTTGKTIALTRWTFVAK